MSTTTTISTSYNGQDAGQIVSRALFSASTLENNLISFKPNVKYKTILKRLSTGNLIQSADCDFSADSTIDLDERELEVVKLKVNLQVCKDDFMDDYLALEMGASAHGDLPKSFSDFLIEQMRKKVANEMETKIWQNSAEFDGLEVLFAADATVIDVAAVAGGITSENVVDELARVHAAIPVSLITNPDLTIYVSQSIASAYVIALGGFAAAGQGGAGTDNKGSQWYNGSSLSFAGVKIVVANGLSQGSVVATTKDNLFFGTSLMSDLNEVKVIDMENIDGSDNVRFIMKMTAGVQYAYGADVVYYA
jgi:hypothetical protein